MRPAFACLAVLLVVSGAAAGLANPVGDAGAAINVARRNCPRKQVEDKGAWDAVLAQNSAPKPAGNTGSWRAELVGNSWHVWFGDNQKEAGCDFRGAYVSADGTHVDCVLTAC